MSKLQKEWTFCDARDIEALKLPMPSLDDLYMQALNSREAKRKTYERALNAALENLCSWERVVRADGFSIQTLADMHGGSPHPVFSCDGKTVTFVQAYGVKVTDERQRSDKK